MASKESWTTIESDPGVFTELLQKMGVQSVQVEELYSLDVEHLQKLKPVYGLIFLFKWRAEKDDRPVDYSALDYVWFANQVINNACATQAILSVIFNCPELELGTELTNLKTFTSEFPPQLKGLSISNSSVVRSVHNSFRPPDMYVSDEDVSKDKDDADVYHFIGYVPIDGVLYELDGLKEGPIRLCECHEGDWLQLVAPFIQARIEQYARNEIRFNLMAIIKNRSEVIEDNLKKLEESKSSLIRELVTDVDNKHKELIENQLAEIEQELVRSREELEQEQNKLRTWREENIRRKHNYIPFLFNFLKILAEKDQLKDLISEAKEKQEVMEKEELDKTQPSHS
eukprot:g8645.t1